MATYFETRFDWKLPIFFISSFRSLLLQMHNPSSIDAGAPEPMSRPNQVFGLTF